LREPVEDRDERLHPFDDNGRFRFDAAPGAYELVITSPRHREQRLRLELDLAEPRVERTIVLVGQQQIFVRLQGPRGGRPFVERPGLPSGGDLTVLATRESVLLSATSCSPPGPSRPTTTS
jgi:hypothetical protein